MARRVLYVHNGADLYGASRSLLRLVSARRELDVEPHVLLPEDGPLRAALEDLGVRCTVSRHVAVVTRPMLKSWRVLPFLLGLPFAVVALAVIIRRGRYLLVHTNTGVVVSPAAAAALARVPHVWHIRDSFRQFGALWPIYSRYVCATSTAVICVSRAIAAQFPSSSSGIFVIHNGLPDEARIPATSADVASARARWRLDRKRVVAVVGRIKFLRKGQEVLVRAAARLAEEFPDVQFLFVGAPFPGNESHDTKLRVLISDLGLADRCIMTGEIPDPKPLYGLMDVLVLPSVDPEPFAGVVLEAMALGIPVVGTNHGGTPDQIDDGVTGLLVPPGDDERLSDALRTLLANEPLRLKMSAEAKARCRARFSLNAMLEQLRPLYDRAMHA